MLILSLIAAAGFLFLAWAFATAPEGWEDREGFHWGTPDVADQGRFDSGQGGHDARPFSPVAFSLHGTPNTHPEQPDHGA